MISIHVLSRGRLPVNDCLRDGTEISIHVLLRGRFMICFARIEIPVSNFYSRPLTRTISLLRFRCNRIGTNFYSRPLTRTIEYISACCCILSERFLFTSSREDDWLLPHHLVSSRISIHVLSRGRLITAAASSNKVEFLFTSSREDDLYCATQFIQRDFEFLFASSYKDDLLTMLPQSP